MPEPAPPNADPVPPAARPAARARVRAPSRRAWRRFRQHRLAWFSAWMLGVLLALTLLWPHLQTTGIARHLPEALAHSPLTLSDAQFEPPSARHWLGTDVHGRDLLARVVGGLRLSLLIGLAGAAVSLVIGVSWGLLSGYVGGRTDAVLMRAVDVLYSLPSLILVIVLVAVVADPLQRVLAERFPDRPGALANVILLFVGLGGVSWLTMARIIRGQVLSLRTRAFVEASRALGAGHGRIMIRQILPNLRGLVIVYLALTVPSIMLYESFLSYLGLGVQPPFASLGSLVADGAASMNSLRTYWWLILYPGSTLTGTLLLLNLVGDGLREAWDPRLD